MSTNSQSHINFNFWTEGKGGFAVGGQVIVFQSLSAQGKKAKVKTLMRHSKVMVAVNCTEAPHLPSKTGL